MADLELQGVIKLTADTSEAEKKAAEIGKKDVAPTPPEQEAGKPKPPASEASTSAAQDVGRQVAGAFASLKGAFATVMGSGGAGGIVGALANVAGAVGGGARGVFNAIGGVGRAGVTGGGAGGGGGAVHHIVAPGGGAGGPGFSVAGAMAAVGPYAAIAAAIATAFAGVVIAAKAVMDRLIAFGRSLAQVSAPMAQAFAMFDVQIMQLKRQMGDALAPVFRDLLQSLILLAKNVLPEFTFIIKMVGEAFTGWILTINEAVGAIRMLAKVQASAAMVVTDPLNATKHLADIATTINNWWDWSKRQNLKNAQQPSGVMDFMHMINAEGSAQRQYQAFGRGGNPMGLAPAMAPNPNAGDIRHSADDGTITHRARPTDGSISARAH